MKTHEFAIEGMHCDGCAATVKALLSAQPGVKGATVSFSEARARVLYDPAVADEVKLAAVIERAGFRVTGTA